MNTFDPSTPGRRLVIVVRADPVICGHSGEARCLAEVALTRGFDDVRIVTWPLDALEAAYPMLQGTLRDHVTKTRRPYVRFFACEEDLSNESPDAPLPEEVVAGKEPFVILGAMAGG